MLKNKACRWSLLSVSVAVAVAAVAPSTYAGEADNAMPTTHGSGDATTIGVDSMAPTSMATSESKVDPSSQELYLEVTLNQSPTGALARFVLTDGQLRASTATLRGLGLRLPEGKDIDGLVALSDIPGIHAEYNAAKQHVALTVPLDLLDRKQVRFGFTQPEAPRIDPLARAPGLILNYDLYGQHGNDISSLNAFSEFRLFGAGAGVWSNTISSRVLSVSGVRSTTQYDSVRLDTSWQLDFPESMVSLTVGDTVTGAVPWSRATRIGGVRLSRNFSLQPYRITAPLASFAGEAALPSTVDLLINGLRQSTQEVQPGQFQIDSVPSLNGVGQAQLVITDVNGQSRLISFSLYGTPQLLEAGLSDWSLDLGSVRRDYGLKSFSYADTPMASASGRYGLNDRTTLDAHGESTEGLHMAGLGGTWLVGRNAGVLSGSVAGSRHEGRSGVQGTAAYQFNSSVLNLYMGTTRRDAGFRDVASLENSPLPRRTDQAFLGLNTDLGQWGMSYVSQNYPGEEPARFASLSWSRQLPRNGSLNLNVSRDLEKDNGYDAFLSWSMPLDRFTTASASARHSRNAQSVSLEASRSAPSDLGGWGWRAQTTLGDNAGGQAQISQLGRFGQWTAGVDHWRGGSDVDSSTTAYATANGGLVLMRGNLYAMRRVDEAFALVTTHGIPNVPVKLENRLVGYTDDDGLLLINRLNSWQRNQLSIDPMQLPVDMLVERTTLDAVPEGRSGMLADFSMRRIVSLQLSLRDENGQPLRAGSPVWLGVAGSNPPLTVVGHDGMVYLQDPPARSTLTVQANDKTCVATLPDLPQPQGRMDLGNVTCR